jgi:N-acetylmuramoyl-L-alanine amidase
MRTINNIVLHCTATPQTTTIQSIQRHWKEVNGWKSPGYHWIIKPDGEAVSLWPIEKPSNGVAGHNSDSIHISYIGGVDKNLKPVDNRTNEQKQTQIRLIKELKAKFPNARVLGHTDFPNVHKDCPSFNVAEWLECVGLQNK